jgi:hypothetical protein
MTFQHHECVRHKIWGYFIIQGYKKEREIAMSKPNLVEDDKN